MSELDTEEQRRVTAALLEGIPRLSPAELQVCLLILEKKSTREIAHTLGVSVKTIHNQRFSIRRKLGTNRNLMIELMKLRGY